MDEVVKRLKTIEEILTVVKPPPMDLGEAAAYLHVSKQTLYRMTSRSEIQHFKPSGKRVSFLRAKMYRLAIFPTAVYYELGPTAKKEMCGRREYLLHERTQTLHNPCK